MAPAPEPELRYVDCSMILGPLNRTPGEIRIISRGIKPCVTGENESGPVPEPVLVLGPPDRSPHIASHTHSENNNLEIRISHICQVRNLEDVVQNNLFPSSKMILCLDKEFGMLPGEDGEELMTKPKESKHDLDYCALQRREHIPLDNFNNDYIAWKTQHEPCMKNFIQTNIEDVHKASSALQKPKPKVFVAKLEDGQSAHNYSIQTMNCTSLAKELLQKEMAKDANQRFCYSQHYQTFTVSPVDPEAEHKAALARSRAAWRTCDGFIFPGCKSSMESNKHPNHPDEARVDELRKPWRENILHDNTLKPFMDRTRWRWSQRHEDFELYQQPPPFISPVPPISIHLAGDVLQREQRKAARGQYARWKSKVLPDKNSDSGQVPEFKCHMRKEGLDKQQDILKDKPMKLTLKKAWKTILPVPPFTVIPPAESEERLEESHRISSTQADTAQYSMCKFGHYWRPHSFQHKRAAPPFTEEEKQLHVFQKPQQVPLKYTDSSKAPHYCNVVRMRTHKRVTVHMM